MDKENNTYTGLEIAVIGLACRFPGARNLEEFWENLKNGVEAVSFFSDQELEETGIAPKLLKNPNYIKAKGVLEDIEYFDSRFFDYSPKEAEIMDPQMRIFHECTLGALEDAGYDPESYKEPIGIYAGASPNFTWEALSRLSRTGSMLGYYTASQLNDKDYLSTRISYKLNLKGPSVTLNTACSTSLVAVHMACRALLTGECSMALAGGVTVTLPPKSGYFFQEGMIMSPDGHCRAFDAEAQGIVNGEGVGIVVLKPLKTALADGDHIYAHIKASAINNDGVRKVGFSAPSIEGQAEAIRAAHHMGEVGPETISYIETHGTGTAIGDPVEIEALKLAFNTGKKGVCAIGSVKTNFGHLDSAAGIAGFIKAVLALTHRCIPPSLHFNTPNPKIDFENSPFYVNTGLSKWESNGFPLRAGVSSFGIGGTNAHVVLEEAPRTDDEGQSQSRGGVSPPNQSREYQLIVLSAKTDTALNKMTENFVKHLRQNPEVNLADAAYTLQVGRKNCTHRRMVVCAGMNEAMAALSPSGSNPGLMQTTSIKKFQAPVVFMFSGQGSQYINMGLDLYKTEPVFRKEMDRCFEILDNLLDYDIKEILYPVYRSDRSNRSYKSNMSNINQTELAQPLLFVFEYALAKLLMNWGIAPYSMIGHSIGEYTAACLSGVFSLKDALSVVVMRGKLMQGMLPGAMLSVFLPEDELRQLLPEDLSLAAVNGPGNCVVSGSHEAIAAFEKRAEQQGYQCRRLHTSHAFHSTMMAPILKQFETAVGKVVLNKPGLPYISNVTGNWITVEEAVTPGYWPKHLRETVRFGDGLSRLMTAEEMCFVEVGPGRVLSTFASKHPQKKPGQKVISLVRHPHEKVSDNYFLLSKVGELWLYGQTINWPEFYAGEKRYRVSLPTYPFEGQRYPVEGDPSLKIAAEMLYKDALLNKKPDIADWFYIPSWERLGMNTRTPGDFPGDSPGSCWLVFTRDTGVGEKLVKRLKEENQVVFTVKPGTDFRRENDSIYTINPQNPGDYDALFKELRELKAIPLQILHLLNAYENRADDKNTDFDEIDRTQNLGFYSLLLIAQAIGRENLTHDLRVMAVTNNMQEVIGEEVICPGKALILGAVKVIPLEYPNINCRSLDIVLPEPGSIDQDKLVDNILAEFTTDSPEREVAFRRNHRWVRRFKPHRLSQSPGVPRKLRQGGVYLVTGGLGGIGFTLAEHLARSVKAKLILVGRSPFPGVREWNHWLSNHSREDPVSLKIRKLMELEALGAEPMVCCADVTDMDQMQAVVTRARKRFGGINGVIHAAGLADYGGIIQRRTRETSESIVAPKVKGIVVLDRILKDVPLDFWILCSSMASILAPFGQVAYSAANAFLDAFALHKNVNHNTLILSINWDTWQTVGMAVEAARKWQGKLDITLEDGILPSEGIDVFCRILEAPLSQVAVSTRDLSILLERGDALNAPEVSKTSGPQEFTSPTQTRPELSTRFVAPSCDMDKVMAQIWQEYLGIDEIGIHDNFFDLGANSLDIIQVNRKLGKVLEKDIPVVTMYTNPTIDSLRRYLSQEETRTGFSEEEAQRLERKKKKGKDKLKQRKKIVIKKQKEKEHGI